MQGSLEVDPASAFESKLRTCLEWCYRQWGLWPRHPLGQWQFQGEV